MWEEVVCTLSVALPLPLLKKGVQTKQESLRLFWGARGKDQWVEVQEEKVLVQ